MKNFDRARRLGTIGDLQGQSELTPGMLVVLLGHCTRQRYIFSQGA